jgi:hypothetical protein
MPGLKAPQELRQSINDPASDDSSQGPGECGDRLLTDLEIQHVFLGQPGHHGWVRRG